jgi:hypothetical protein
MAGRLNRGLVTLGLLFQLALYPVGAQEPQIRDGYVPLEFLKKKPGTHYLLRGYRVGLPSDNFYGIMIPEEKVGIPGLAISGLEPGAPYKIIKSECDEEGNCTEDGYIVRDARERK